MVTLSFEAAAARFSHVDGVISRTTLQFPAEAEIAVRLYPWWEHPKYTAARAQGRGWSFADYSPLAKDVVVRARDLKVVHLISDPDATDLGLTECGPTLWDTDEERAGLLVNGTVEWRELAEALDIRLRAAGCGSGAEAVRPWLRMEPGRFIGPGCLATVPRQLHAVLQGALSDAGADYLREAPPRWSPRGRRLLAVVGGCYLVATDIVVDVPDFDFPDAICQIG